MSGTENPIMNQNEPRKGSIKDEKKEKKKFNKNGAIGKTISSLLLILGVVLIGLYFVPSASVKGPDNLQSSDPGAVSSGEGSDDNNGLLEKLGEARDGVLGSIPGGIKNIGKPLVDPSNVGVSYNGDLYSNGQDQMFTLARDGGDVGFAPAPTNQFRDAKCEAAPKNQEKPSNQSWSAPSIGQKGSWNYSGFNNSVMTVPAAPQSTMYASNAHLSDKEGAVLQLGHVNYNENPYQLSPFGLLHKLTPCERIYQTDENGNTYEFVVTDMYTVGNKDFPLDSQYFRKDGEKALYMVTCSGPQIGDAGNRIDGLNWASMGYEYNLVVKAVPVSE